MADDANATQSDLLLPTAGLGHLYYQHLCPVGGVLGLLPGAQQLSPDQLEILRQKIGQAINSREFPSPATLWAEFRI